MSILQTSRLFEVSSSMSMARRHQGRLAMLACLFLLSFGLSAWMRVVAPTDVKFSTPFMMVWIISFVPYVAACAFVLLTAPVAGRQGWLELGIILLGALGMRVLLLPLSPNLSHDSWRYLWDARVTLLGYSPYATTPGSTIFIHLRDFIFQNSRYRDVPTIYPPGAQVVYILSYLLAPSNLYVLKALFIGFDMVTCGALAFFLYQQGLDPRRTILYAWCPLPIIEFAVQGHLDAITVTFSLLAILSASHNETRWRVLTGFLVAIAALTKIYPILLLVVVLRPQRRDIWLLAACFLTIVLAYVPYYILGHGQILGFFSKYANQQGTNAGVVQLMMQWVGQVRNRGPYAAVVLEHQVDLIFLGVVSLGVLVLRWRRQLSMASATLILYGAALAISSHVFPWYTTTLLPWIAVLVGPLWVGKHLSGKQIAAAAAWYFVCVSLIGYFFDSTMDWRLYYAFVYDIVLAGLALAAISGFLWIRTRAKSFKGEY